MLHVRTLNKAFLDTLIPCNLISPEIEPFRHWAFLKVLSMMCGFCYRVLRGETACLHFASTCVMLRAYIVREVSMNFLLEICVKPVWPDRCWRGEPATTAVQNKTAAPVKMLRMCNFPRWVRSTTKASSFKLLSPRAFLLQSVETHFLFYTLLGIGDWPETAVLFVTDSITDLCKSCQNYVASMFSIWLIWTFKIAKIDKKWLIF